MIVSFVTFVLGSSLGYAVSQGLAAKEREKLDTELRELRRRVELAQARGVSAPAILPSAEYREPDLAAIINLPVDQEDFDQLHEAMCACVTALRHDKAEGEMITREELRNCLLEAIYPDFTWPPVPGDKPEAQLMWLIADHEARKTLADPSVCPATPSTASQGSTSTAPLPITGISKLGGPS